MDKKLILKNYHLKTLVGTKMQQGWLDIPLHGEETKARTVVFKIFMDAIEHVEEDRMKIIDRHAEVQVNYQQKDGVMTHKTEEKIIENGQYQLKDQKAFEAEYEALMNLEHVFEINDDNKKSFAIVKDIVIKGYHNRGFTFKEQIVQDEIEAEFKKI